ncbi:MAG: hypothetical protein ACO2O0_00440 [Desulfurococcales archaeon]
MRSDIESRDTLDTGSEAYRDVVRKFNTRKRVFKILGDQNRFQKALIPVLSLK